MTVMLTARGTAQAQVPARGVLFLHSCPRALAPHVEWALAGIAGTTQILGTEQHLTMGVSASFGIDAITVALLGRSNPWGVLAAGILFGGLRAGASTMQAEQGVPVDIVLVVQSMIVLFIAAPPLVRAMFRLGKEAKNEAF